MPFFAAVAALCVGVALPGAAQASPAVSGEIDLLELHIGKGDEHLRLESSFAYGLSAGGKDQFVVKIDGGSDTRPAFDNIQVQALYARALSGSVTLLVGARRDMRTGTDLSYAALGIEAALAPWLDAEHYGYLSQNGDLGGSAKLTGHWALSPRLTLEPRFIVNWSAQAVPTEALGAGMTGLEGSVRLRRAIGRHADLYAGFVQERLTGQTRTIAVAAGQPPVLDRAVIGAGFRF